MSIVQVESNGELRFASRIIPKCRVVFDVGARNDDYFVHLTDQCDFHLFEPLEGHYRDLRKKVNGLEHVVVNNRALGNGTGTYEIHPDSESIVKRSNSLLETVSIQMTRLDDYCRENQVKNIDFLKVDTEGHELEVLKGGREMVQSATEVVQFEYGGTYRDAGITLKMVFDFLGPQWNFYLIEPRRLAPIKRYKKSYENYRYANYVASRRPLEQEVVGESLLRSLLVSLRPFRKAA